MPKFVIDREESANKNLSQLCMFQSVLIRIHPRNGSERPHLASNPDGRLTSYLFSADSKPADLLINIFKSAFICVIRGVEVALTHGPVPAPESPSAWAPHFLPRRQSPTADNRPPLPSTPIPE